MTLKYNRCRAQLYMSAIMSNSFSHSSSRSDLHRIYPKWNSPKFSPLNFSPERWCSNQVSQSLILSLQITYRRSCQASDFIECFALSLPLCVSQTEYQSSGFEQAIHLNSIIPIDQLGVLDWFTWESEFGHYSQNEPKYPFLEYSGRQFRLRKSWSALESRLIELHVATRTELINNYMLRGGDMRRQSYVIPSSFVGGWSRIVGLQSQT